MACGRKQRQMPLRALRSLSSGINQNNAMMKSKLNLKELVPLADFINDNYDGDLARLNNDIHNAIYLLNHVKKDEIAEEAVENATFALHQISQQLFSSYLRKLVD